MYVARSFMSISGLDQLSGENFIPSGSSSGRLPAGMSKSLAWRISENLRSIFYLCFLSSFHALKRSFEFFWKADLSCLSKATATFRRYLAAPT